VAECFIKDFSEYAAGETEREIHAGRVRRERREQVMRETGLEYHNVPAILISQPPKAIKHKSNN